MRKKVLSELGVGHGYPQPLASQLLVMGIGVPAVDSVLQCLAVFPALVMTWWLFEASSQKHDLRL